MQLIPVSTTVDLICGTFACVPIKLYQEYTDEKGRRKTREISDSRVRIINDDTGDTLDGFQFKKAIAEDYLMGKGGYAVINKSGNTYKSLHYVECDKVSIMKGVDPVFKSFDVMINGNRYRNDQVITFLRNTKDGAEGKGMTEEIATSLSAAFERLKYELSLAKTGGSRKGFLKSAVKLSPDSIKELKKAWNSYYSGNADTMILNNGVEFQEASNTSRENEIAAKNNSFAKDIKDLFHCGGSYDDFLATAITPMLNAFVSQLNKWLLLEKEKNSYYYAADIKVLHKGSIKERYEAYKIAIETGFKTRNEIRYIEDDDAIEGLDMITLGLGDVFLDVETGTVYTPNTNVSVKLGEEVSK